MNAPPTSFRRASLQAAPAKVRIAWLARAVLLGGVSFLVLHGNTGPVHAAPILDTIDSNVVAFGVPLDGSQFTPYEDRSPRLAADGAGNVVAVWNSGDTLASTIGSDQDLLVARSADNGATWSDPAALNTDAAADLYQDRQPQVATDGAGTWVVVWTREGYVAAPIGEDLDIMVSRSADAGATWTAPAPLNSNAGSDSDDDAGPSLATDAEGNWVAVWGGASSPGGDSDILAARSTDGGATWSPVASLLTDAGSDARHDADPVVAMISGGRVLAVWSASGGPTGADADLFWAASTDAGATWSSPSAVRPDAATDGAVDFMPSVAGAEDGTWILTWTSDDDLGGTIGTDFDILFATSSDLGSSWTAPAALPPWGGSAWEAFWPRIETDGLGNWMAVWASGDIDPDPEQRQFHLAAAFSTDNGSTWTTTGIFSLFLESDAIMPDVVVSGDGLWLSAWQVVDHWYSGQSSVSPTILSSLHSLCGDGALAGAEECDDGANDSGDCCSDVCVAETGDPCTDDGIDCTVDVCSSSGTCGVPDHAACDDSQPCSPDICVPAFGCVNDVVPRDEETCLVSERAKVQVIDSDKPGRDSLRWSWIRGDSVAQEDLGAPTLDTDYALCVYDRVGSTPSLAVELEIPASSFWQDRDPKGVLYKDPDALSAGVKKARLSTGVRGKATLVAKGENLLLPGAFGATYFSQDPEVIVQLVNEEGTCWTSRFEPADSKNTPTSFKARRR